jgi:hypothetical protein
MADELVAVDFLDLLGEVRDLRKLVSDARGLPCPAFRSIVITQGTPLMGKKMWVLLEDLALLKAEIQDMGSPLADGTFVLPKFTATDEVDLPSIQSTRSLLLQLKDVFLSISHRNG